MSRFTVIGARGFIGGRLAAALRERGDSVYAPPRGEAELFDQDLGFVFYCAGLTGDFHVRPFDTVEAHVSFLAQVLKRGRFERLVYLSSTRVYDSLGEAGGDETDRLVFDPAAARNVYDLSKALGENLTLARSDSRGAVARLSNVFDWSAGAGGFLSDLLVQARRRKAIDLPASAPAAVRDYIHADDVVAALIAMADRRAEGVVNLASGRNLSNRELAGVFQQAGWRLTLGEDRPVTPAPRCATTRLRGLGVAPRDPVEVIAQALADPAFFEG